MIDKKTNQIIAILEIIMDQNHFSFQDQLYEPENGVATCLTISGTKAEILLHIENIHIKHLLDSMNTAFLLQICQ